MKAYLPLIIKLAMIGDVLAFGVRELIVLDRRKRERALEAEDKDA